MKHLKIGMLLIACFSVLFFLSSCDEKEPILHVHEYGDWVVLDEATCLAEGVKGRDCKSCPAFERESISKIEHEYVENKNVVDPGCEKEGSKLYICKHCKDIKIESVESLGHNFNGGICTRCSQLEKELSEYTISLELNGGELYTTSIKYTEGSKVVLPNPTKDNYVFVGWYTTSDYEKNSEVSTIVVKENITLYAKWEVLGCVVTLDANGGYVEESQVVLKENRMFSLEVPSTDKYEFFVGWYLGEQQLTDEFGKGLKSWDISEDVKVVAKYETSKTVDDVTFMYEGEYPQTVVTNEETIKALSKITETNKRGYLEYNGRQYAKYVYAGRKSVAKFNNGEILEKGKTYYFLVEPILWRIVDPSNGIAVAEKIIDTMVYYENSKEHKEQKDAHPNNYEYSDVSSWLNCDIKHADKNFIFGAFSDPNAVLSLRKDIDNSAKTTSDENNKYACITTTAFLYLLSYQEVTSNYSIRINMESKVTDYAVIRGVSVDNYTMNGEWWLRSPSATKPNYALTVSTTGEIFESSVDNSKIGVRPVGKFIKLNK